MIRNTIQLPQQFCIYDRLPIRRPCFITINNCINIFQLNAFLLNESIIIKKILQNIWTVVYPIFFY